MEKIAEQTSQGSQAVSRSSSAELAQLRRRASLAESSCSSSVQTSQQALSISPSKALAPISTFRPSPGSLQAILNPIESTMSQEELGGDQGSNGEPARVSKRTEIAENGIAQDRWNDNMNLDRSRTSLSPQPQTSSPSFPSFRTSRDPDRIIGPIAEIHTLEDGKTLSFAIGTKFVGRKWFQTAVYQVCLNHGFKTVVLSSPGLHTNTTSLPALGRYALACSKSSRNKRRKESSTCPFRIRLRFPIEEWGISDEDVEYEIVAFDNQHNHAEEVDLTPNRRMQEIKSLVFKPSKPKKQGVKPMKMIKEEDEDGEGEGEEKGEGKGDLESGVEETDSKKKLTSSSILQGRERCVSASPPTFEDSQSQSPIFCQDAEPSVRPRDEMEDVEMIDAVDEETEEEELFETIAVALKQAKQIIEIRRIQPPRSSP